ncbi:MAG: hypothetical protein P8Y36_08750, partial [Alphaproteobacteria bacterium]
SDMDFFLRAVRRGVRIVWMNGPKVAETVPAERATYSWQVKRAYRNGALTGKAAFKCPSTPLPRVFLKTLGRILTGITSLILALVVLPFRRAAFKMLALDGGRHLGWAIGVLAGMHGHMPEPYRKIDGR